MECKKRSNLFYDILFLPLIVSKREMCLKNKIERIDFVKLL